jgi:TolB-like protein
MAVRIAAALFVLAIASPLAISAKQTKIAVLDFNNSAKLGTDEIDYLTDLVRGVALGLSQATYFVITKENILEILPPGADLACTEGQCEVKAGQMIGADLVVSGGIIRFAGELKVTLKLHETESSRLLATETASAKTVGELEGPVRAAAARVLGNLTGGLQQNGSVSFRDSGVVGVGKMEGGVKIDKGENIVNALTDVTGFLVIKTEPVGATVFLNGKEVGVARTSLQLEKPIGKYVVVAEMGKLYHPARQEVDLTTDGARLVLTLPPAFGALIVISEPSGAEVWLEGEKVGITPFRKEQQRSGRYEVRVVKENYLTHTVEAVVEDAQAAHVKAKLEQNFGSLEVTSEPAGADILLNEAATDYKTPHTFPLLQPGFYAVKLRLDGYGEAVEKAAVKNGEEARVRSVLEAKLGQLSIMAEYADGTPCEGKVFLDGEEKGTSPLKLQVIAVEHALKVVCEKGSVETRVSVGHNEKKSLVEKIETDEVLVDAVYDTGGVCTGNLMLDGKPVGSTPWSQRLKAGRHEFKVKCPKGEGKSSNNVTGKGRESVTVRVATQRFSKVGKDALLDNQTGLMWQTGQRTGASFDAFSMAQEGVTYSQAASYCDNLVLEKHSDWRMPTADELGSLVNGCAFIPLANCRRSQSLGRGCDNRCEQGSGPGSGGCYMHPGFSCTPNNARYWSTDKSEPSNGQPTAVYYDYSIAMMHSETLNTAFAYARCVRSAGNYSAAVGSGAGMCAPRGTSVDEVIVLTRLGIPETDILKAIEKDNAVFCLQPHDITALKDARVKDSVMKRIMEGPRR